MALIKCPGCGGQVSDRAKKCPKCGFDIKGGLTKGGECAVAENMSASNPEIDIKEIEERFRQEYENKLQTSQKKIESDFAEKISKKQQDLQDEYNSKLKIAQSQIKEEYVKKLQESKDFGQQELQKKLEKEYEKKLQDAQAQLEQKYERQFQVGEDRRGQLLTADLEAQRARLEKEFEGKLRDAENQLRQEYQQQLQEHENRRREVSNSDLEEYRARLDREFESKRVTYEAKRKLELDQEKERLAKDIEKKCSEKYEGEKAELLKLIDDLTKKNETTTNVPETHKNNFSKSLILIGVLCVLLAIGNVGQVVYHSSKMKQVSNELAEMKSKKSSEAESASLNDMPNEVDDQKEERIDPSESVVDENKTGNDEKSIIKNDSEVVLFDDKGVHIEIYKCIYVQDASDVQMNFDIENHSKNILEFGFTDIKVDDVSVNMSRTSDTYKVGDVWTSYSILLEDLAANGVTDFSKITCKIYGKLNSGETLFEKELELQRDAFVAPE